MERNNNGDSNEDYFDISIMGYNLGLIVKTRGGTRYYKINDIR